MFPAFLMPMLIGAGTGALGGLLTGKDPLKGALMGGVTGGLLGSVPALGAGGVGAGGASVSVASPTASMFGSPVGATGLVGAGNSALGAGIGANAATAPIMSSIPMEGVNAFTESVKPLASNIPDMGAQAFTQQPSMFESFYDTVSPYLDVRDLSSAALNSQYQDRPMPTPQSGRITEGRAPQGNDVMALLQTMKLPERRRISLI